MTMNENDESIQKAMSDLYSLVNKRVNETIKLAYQKTIDPNNFDIKSVQDVLRRVPRNIWTPPNEKSKRIKRRRRNNY